MPIENRNLASGTRLVARYKRKDHVCEVVQTDDGIAYRTGGREYGSPSSAARAVTRGVAVNGWRFWSLEAEAKPARATKPTTATKRAGKKPAVKKGVTKEPAAKKPAAKADAYGCGVCPETFASMTAATAHVATHGN